MEGFRNFGQQLVQAWQRMSAPRQIMLTALAVICFGLIGGVWYWASQPDYVVLFSGLAPEDAGAITGKLQSQGAQYRLASGGTTILVPSEQLYQRRLDLASEGLPAKGDKGWSILDGSPLGATPFTENANYVRALQAELARTLTHIDPIANARVIIVRPNASAFFSRERQPTTASVLLELRRGAVLSQKTANGIVALVSRSVEGLAPENVAVLDDKGRLLSDPQAAEGGSISSQMESVRELERQMERKAEEVLFSVLGAGRAVIRVTAEMNFQRLHEKKEIYSPTGRVVISEKTTANKGASTAPTAGRGPAGVTANQGKNAPAQPQPVSGGSDETQETVYKPTTTIQEMEDKNAKLERLTVAAFVDLSGVATSKDGAPAITLAEIEEQIKQAVGFKKDRDEIKVTNARLSPPQLPVPAEDEAHNLQQMQNILSIVRNASLGLAALVALVLSWMIIRRLRPLAKSAPAPASKTGAESVPPRVVAEIQQDPEALAKVLAGWLDQAERQQRTAA
jgi:flagellar M-ring protein FliF